MTKPTTYRNFVLFAGLLALTWALILLTNHYILTPGFYEKSGQSVAADSQRAMTVYDKIQPYIYVASAIYLLLKVAAVVLILQTALYLSGQLFRLSKVIQLVLCAEYLFLIPAVWKIVLFRYFFPDGTLEHWHRYYLLSAITLFPKVGAAWIYPLQTLNFFEIAYWFLIARGIYRLTGWTFDDSLQLVLKSYVPALLLWVTLITFGTLILFPQAS